MGNIVVSENVTLDGDRKRLSLVESRTVGTGLVQLSYRIGG